MAGAHRASRGLLRGGPEAVLGPVDSALGPNDFEYVDATLTRLLEHVIADARRRGQAMPGYGPSIGASDRRRVAGPARRLGRDRRVPAAVRRLGAVGPAAAPGSKRSTDEMAFGVVRPESAAASLGFEIDARVIAFGFGSGQSRCPARKDRLPATRFSASCGPAATRPSPASRPLPAVRARRTARPAPCCGGPRRAIWSTSTSPGPTGRPGMPSTREPRRRGPDRAR